MNDRTRTARRTIAQRSATARAAARIRRSTVVTLSTYATAAGLHDRDARSMAGSLRSVAKRLAVTGTAGSTFRKGQRRDCQRYTITELRIIAAAYKPRRQEFRTARTYLLAI
ncbi:MAG TPA: hypothetical protein VF760_03265 [Xanthobacteraceae bacterium]